MPSLENKLIVYDSNCKVCSSFRDIVLKLTNIPEQKIKAYRDLTPELSAHVDSKKFKNVMALVDISGGATVYGAEGVAYIFSSQYRIISFLLNFKLIFSVFRFLYKTQAYNRYIIATPKSKFKCDCLPDRVIKYRVSYIAITLFISVLLTAWFGVSLKNFFINISTSQAAMQMLLMAGTGWALQILLAIFFIKDKALDYVGHLCSIMVVGLLILVPWMIFYTITGILNWYVPALSVLISAGYMLYLHVKRAQYLELNQLWTMSWFLLLQAGGIFWIFFFHMR